MIEPLICLFVGIVFPCVLVLRPFVMVGDPCEPLTYSSDGFSFLLVALSMVYTAGGVDG